MTSSAATARVLVATDNANEGTQVQRLLEPHFQHVSVSSNPETAVPDFEDCKPDVVVLAFDTIEKAQCYCLGLYRFGSAPPPNPPRTILLCTKSEVTAAFELCKKQYFDDYVLHWPMVHDGKRLPMSVWIASREVLASRTALPARPGLRSYAKPMETLETTLDREFSAAVPTPAVASTGGGQLDQDVSAAGDTFSQQPDEGATCLDDGALSALSRESARLKDMLTKQNQHVREIALTPMSSWASNTKRNIAPAPAGTRHPPGNLRNTRPVIMVVEDDEMSREAVIRALDSTLYELHFAPDGIAAWNQLRDLHPDAILMDIRLPGLDGVSLTKNIKAAPQLSGVPIIMVTGDSRRESLLSSIGAGAQDFIVKPYTRESLNAKLQRALSASNDTPPSEFGNDFPNSSR